MRAARRGRRMRIDHGFAAVQLLEDRKEVGISQEFPAVARPEVDAVGLERLERILDLAKGALDIGKRDRGERPKRPGWSREFAAYSFETRAILRNPDITRPCLHARVDERMKDVAMPLFSMSSSEACGGPLGVATLSPSTRWNSPVGRNGGARRCAAPRRRSPPMRIPGRARRPQAPRRCREKRAGLGGRRATWMRRSGRCGDGLDFLLSCSLIVGRCSVAVAPVSRVRPGIIALSFTFTDRPRDD